jgi:hypothetical protein
MAADRITRTFVHVQTCIEEAVEIVSVLGNASWFKRVFNLRENDEKLQRARENLTSCLLQLNTAMVSAIYAHVAPGSSPAASAAPPSAQRAHVQARDHTRRVDVDLDIAAAAQAPLSATAGPAAGAATGPPRGAPPPYSDTGVNDPPPPYDAATANVNWKMAEGVDAIETDRVLAVEETTTDDAALRARIRDYRQTIQGQIQTVLSLLRSDAALAGRVLIPSPKAGHEDPWHNVR